MGQVSGYGPALLATSRWRAGDTCLRRCLLLGQRLRRLDPVLRIGVRRDEPGAFQAHSWLKISGRSLDIGSADFETLGRFLTRRFTPTAC